MGAPFASYGREYVVASLRTAIPPSPKAMSVPNTRPATTRYVAATENSGRAMSPLRPTPMAATTMISTASTSSETSSTSASAPPPTSDSARNGTATRRNAPPVATAARSLPSMMSPVEAAVTWTAARVAASRSPLIALPLRVGETSTTSSSTMLTTIEYTPAPTKSPHEYTANASPVTPSRMRANTPSRTYQPTLRSRWVSSSRAMIPMLARLMLPPPFRSAPRATAGRAVRRMAGPAALVAQQVRLPRAARGAAGWKRWPAAAAPAED